MFIGFLFSGAGASLNPGGKRQKEIKTHLALIPCGKKNNEKRQQQQQHKPPPQHKALQSFGPMGSQLVGTNWHWLALAGTEWH